VTDTQHESQIRPSNSITYRRWPNFDREGLTELFTSASLSRVQTLNIAPRPSPGMSSHTLPGD